MSKPNLLMATITTTLFSRQRSPSRLPLLALLVSAALAGCSSGPSVTPLDSDPVQSAGNHAPVISGQPATSAAVSADYRFQPTATDADQDSLTFSIANAPSWAEFNTQTGLLSGTPATGDAGEYANITISVSDGKVSASLPVFSITVTGGSTSPPPPTNSAPVISGTPTTSVGMGHAYSFEPTASDADGDTLAFTITNKPSWLTFDAVTGALSGTPAQGDVGTFGNIVISVSDGSETTALDAFSIAVTATADSVAPAVSISSPTSAGTFTASSASVGLSGTASDNVGVVQVTWSNSQGGSGVASGTASWSVPSVALASAANVITVTASDAAGNKTTKTLTVTYTAPASSGTTYYLSPSGNDSSTGLSATLALKTFSKASSKIHGGDALILLDGTYTSGNDWRGTGDGQVPSGSSRNAPTVIRAANPGKAHVRSLFVGRSTRKDSYITFQDLTFDNGCMLYNSSFVTLKNVGCNGGIDVGTNDGEWGNTDNLFEDVWAWATGQRVIAINYRADRNVWRRVIVRGDGCGTADCAGSGNPNVGFTIYDSSDVSAQNVMVLDRVLTGGDSGYADFACAQHTTGAHLYGRNEWLGIVSLNAPDSGMYCEPDNVISGATTGTVTNAVFWNSSDTGINMARTGSYALSKITTKSLGGDGVRVAPEITQGSVSGILVMGAGRYGINSSLTPTNSIVAAGGFNQTTCSGCSTSAPALTSVVQTPVNGIGATIVNRYGTDGSHFGDAGYDTQSSAPLWPWPNEARIKTEMCASISRGFCSSAHRVDGTGTVTITSYLWEQLGNATPSNISP